MKKLYLLRHAKSSWHNFFIKDYDRPINKKGDDSILYMTKLLNKKNINIDLIISSGALRAITTAKEIAKSVNNKDLIINDDLYNKSHREIEQIISKVDDSINSLMIVGHNPALTILSYELIGNDKNIETCSFIEINLKSDSWRNISTNDCEFVSYKSPFKNI